MALFTRNFQRVRDRSPYVRFTEFAITRTVAPICATLDLSFKSSLNTFNRSQIGSNIGTIGPFQSRRGFVETTAIEISLCSMSGVCGGAVPTSSGQIGLLLGSKC